MCVSVKGGLFYFKDKLSLALTTSVYTVGYIYNLSNNIKPLRLSSVQLSSHRRGSGRRTDHPAVRPQRISLPSLPQTPLPTPLPDVAPAVEAAAAARRTLGRSPRGCSSATGRSRATTVPVLLQSRGGTGCSMPGGPWPNPPTNRASPPSTALFSSSYFSNSYMFQVPLP